MMAFYILQSFSLGLVASTPPGTTCWVHCHVQDPTEPFTQNIAKASLLGELQSGKECPRWLFSSPFSPYPPSTHWFSTHLGKESDSVTNTKVYHKLIITPHMSFVYFKRKHNAQLKEGDITFQLRDLF